jgi:hypothetical protein
VDIGFPGPCDLDTITRPEVEAFLAVLGVLALFIRGVLLGVGSGVSGCGRKSIQSSYGIVSRTI